MPARATENGPYRDIHNRKITYERSFKALAASSISDVNRQLILGFVRHKRVAENVSVSRQTKYLHYLRILAGILGKNFDEASTADIEDLLEKAYCRPVKRGETVKEASAWTKRDIAMLLKTFYKWLKKKDNPDEVSWIRLPKVEHPILCPLFLQDVQLFWCTIAYRLIWGA